jgi:hypothetical protein
VAIYDTAKDESSVQRFFNSFTTLDYAQVKWDNHTSADNSFSTWSPTAFTYQRKKDEDGKPEWKYECYDSSRADNYGIIADEFSKYYWQNSDSALWNEVIARYSSDSVLVKKKISNHGLEGYELELKANGFLECKTIKILFKQRQTVHPYDPAGSRRNQ